MEQLIKELEFKFKCKQYANALRIAKDKKAKHIIWHKFKQLQL